MTPSLRRRGHIETEACDTHVVGPMNGSPRAFKCTKTAPRFCGVVACFAPSYRWIWAVSQSPRMRQNPKQRDFCSYRFYGCCHTSQKYSAFCRCGRSIGNRRQRQWRVSHSRCAPQPMKNKSLRIWNFMEIYRSRNSSRTIAAAETPCVQCSHKYACVQATLTNFLRRWMPSLPCGTVKGNVLSADFYLQ